MFLQQSAGRNDEQLAKHSGTQESKPELSVAKNKAQNNSRASNLASVNQK
jgi:hypothetical protein